MYSPALGDGMYHLCRVPLSPKWATPGLGSDFAITISMLHTLSVALYLSHMDSDNTSVSITNPHICSAMRIANRAADSTRHGGGSYIRPRASCAHVPVGTYSTSHATYELTCGHLYTCTDATVHVDGHNTLTIQSAMHIM